MSSQKSRTYFLSRFFAQIAGSWAITPIGFLLAQAMGQGSNQYLHLYLVLSSLTSGCGLFLNEILAPQGACLNVENSRFCKGEMICYAVSALSTSLYLILFAAKVPWVAFSTTAGIVLVLATLIALRLSYGSSLLFCRSLTSLGSVLPKRLCVVLGFLPPLVSQLFILMISLVGRDNLAAPGFALLVLIVLMPNLIQYIFAKFWVKGFGSDDCNLSQVMKPPFQGESLIVLLILTAASLTTTLLKSHLSSFAGSYSNLAFLAMNMLATVAMVFTKTSFLSRPLAIASIASDNRRAIYLTASLLCLNAFFVNISQLSSTAYCFWGFALIASLSISIQIVLYSSRSLLLF